MSRLHSRQQTTTTPELPAPLPNARKLANKQRRKAGRERHEERKVQLKGLEWDRRWQRHERDAQRQEKRPDDGTHPFAGRNVDNLRIACLHLRTSEDGDDEQEEQPEEQDAAGVAEELIVGPLATSGAMLLSMAQPAKNHHRGRHRPSVLEMTDGEVFEVVEIDGCLVALDEDGWEILPDENTEASLLYSDVVRGIMR